MKNNRILAKIKKTAFDKNEYMECKETIKEVHELLMQVEEKLCYDVFGKIHGDSSCCSKKLIETSNYIDEMFNSRFKDYIDEYDN